MATKTKTDEPEDEEVAPEPNTPEAPLADRLEYQAGLLTNGDKAAKAVMLEAAEALR